MRSYEDSKKMVVIPAVGAPLRIGRGGSYAADGRLLLYFVCCNPNLSASDGGRESPPLPSRGEKSLVLLCYLWTYKRRYRVPESRHVSKCLQIAQSDLGGSGM